MSRASSSDSCDSFNEKRGLGTSVGRPPSPRMMLARLTELMLQSLRTRLMTSSLPGSSQADSARRSARTQAHSSARISFNLATRSAMTVQLQPVKCADDNSMRNLAGANQSRHFSERHEADGDVFSVVEVRFGDSSATGRKDI